MLGSGEAWVTIAVDDGTAIKSLVLAKSLRKAYTTRPIVVVVPNAGISPKLMKCLKEAFSGVFPFEKIPGYEDQDQLYAQLYCWTLPLLSKCVYLDPNCLVLKNSDDLFKFEAQEKKVAINSDGTIVVFKPSATVSPDLLTPGKSKDSFIEIIQKQYSADNGVGVTKLARSFDISISLDPKFTLARDEYELSIVKMEGIQICPDFSIKGLNNVTSCTGMLEKSICKYWYDIYRNEITPGINNLSALKASPHPLLNPNHPEPIAIVGMSCRFPKDAHSPQEFWQILTSAIDGIDFLKQPRGNFAPSDYKLPGGYLSCPIDEFDNKFFGISSADMNFLDPQTRLLSEVVWEALEDAGISPHSLYSSQTGIFTGIWTNDYKDILNQASIPTEDFFRKYLGNGFGSISARISHFLGLSGPNIATESGCSSSMIGVDLACQSLRTGRCDLTLACGVNLILHRFETHIEGLTAADSHSKVFDASADGFGRGEGCGVLVLKRYSDALSSGDQILGLIRGIGSSQEGMSRTMGTPTLECETSAMKLALKMANVQPWEVSYVEAHGTGTAVGDPLEIAAISSVYCSRIRDEVLIIGSVKTNIGHTESCSGIAGIIKTVLALKHELIPQHLNFNTLNPSINLDVIPARLPLEPIDWPRSVDKPRIAGVSSFGITGTNAHAIIQEAPIHDSLEISKSSDLKLQRPLHLLTLSAQSQKALDDLLAKYGEYFQTEPEDSLADICYTANVGRSHFPYRVAIMGKTRTEIVKKITAREFVRNDPKIGKKRPKVCFLFTGQGCHYREMGQSLYKTCPTFRLHFDQCDSIFKSKYNLSILQIPKDISNLSRFLQTVYTLIPMFIVECCLTKLWASWGITPDYVMGHSLGEVAACVASNILTFEDALKLIMERTKLIDLLNEEGNMMVIRSDKDTVAELLRAFYAENSASNELIEFAAINSNNQVVVSGKARSIDKFLKICQNNNLSCQLLNTGQAYHSSMMSPIVDRCTEVMKGTAHSKPTCGYISCMRGKVLEDGEMGPHYWAVQLLNTVQFMPACHTALSEGCDVFIETGPHPVLSTFVLANQSGRRRSLSLLSQNKLVGDTAEGQHVICLPSLRMKMDDWTVILGSLSKVYIAGFDINWSKFDQFYGRRKIRGLPTYQFQRKRFWFETPQNTISGRDNNNSLQFSTNFNNTKVHPLIGNLVPSVTPAKIFNTSLILEDIPYVKDHIIGSKVLLPGAGFVEIVLTAGHLAFQGQHDIKSWDFPTNPLRLENLQIEAPLELKPFEYSGLQTMVEFLSSPSESQVSIFRLANVLTENGNNNDTTSSTKWVKHSQAKFSVPSVTECLPREIKLTQNSIPSIEASCQEHIDPEVMYTKLAALGQNFGPFFKSLKTLRRSKEDGQILASITIPQDSGKYFCHPVVIDAMIQVYALAKFKTMDDLHVPVNIGNFTWFANTTDTTSTTTDSTATAFIHAYFQKSDATIDEKSPVVILYDNSGKLLASISNIQLIRTSLSAINNALEKQSMTAAVGIYEDIWRERLGPLHLRADNLKMWNRRFVPQSALDKLPQISSLTQDEETTWCLTQRLCFLYILNAFYTLGWKPKKSKQEIIELDKFTSELSILECHRKLVTQFLKVLAEENVVENFDENRWIVLETPGKSDILLEIKEILHQLQGNGPIEAISACGKQLDSLLKGQRSGLEVLFSEDAEGQAIVSKIYSEGSRHKFLINLLSLIGESLQIQFLNLPPEHRGIVRFLEVGAGTGGATQPLLKLFDDLNIKYHYTFTDISSGFFIKGAKRLEAYKDRMDFKVFNAEEDPLTQGFAPGQFDFVIASFVIHATKNLRESLRNIRTVTADNGIILLIESAKPIRDLDITFGLLDGYWRFEDHEVRPDHCIVGQDKWKAVLASEGYDSIQGFNYHKNDSFLMSANATPRTHRNIDKIVQANLPAWVIFCDKPTYIEELRMHFALSGRRIIEVWKSKSTKELKRVSDTQFEISPSDKTSMDQIFKTLIDMGVYIEGILYTWHIGDSSFNPQEICLSYLNLVQAVCESSQTNKIPAPKVFVATQGQRPVGDEFQNLSCGSILWGMSKCFLNESVTLNCRCIDIDPEGPNVQELFMELWMNDAYECQVSFRESKRYVKRYTPFVPEWIPLTLPNVENYDVILPESKSIDDLSFEPMALTTPLGSDEIEVQVKANGLNFKDIFVILKPNEKFKNFKVIGDDYSGIVTQVGSNVTKNKVGDAVFGCNFACGVLPRYLRIKQDLLMTLPDTMTFYEGATLPVVSATAYHCLIDIANLKSGETVLIHTASGGVGLAAIQLAKAVGAKIIATAGSHRKRAYLRNIVGLQHVYHSRNTEYGPAIMALTNGEGVQVVLNSLTGPGFKEASLQICGPQARFIEMSKLDIWTKAEVTTLRSDVKYEVVDLTTLNETEWTRLFQKIQAHIISGTLGPLPYEKFDIVNLREALTYLMKAKHLGKVVLSNADRVFENGTFVSKTELFNTRSTYLITGGLGGVGLEVAKWMCSSGAKNIILVGRSQPNLKATEVISALNSQGNNILTRFLDIGDFEKSAELIAWIKESNLPPLRGVMHAAGSLSDAFIQSLTLGHFEKTFRSKVNGTWNLHRLTLDLHLEHFILFSTLTACTGNSGQATHAAANSFMDSLAFYRHSMGLPALTVNWGQWGQTGVAAEIRLTGVTPFTPAQAFSALELLMKSHKTQGSVEDIDHTLLQKVYPWLEPYFEEVKKSSGGTGDIDGPLGGAKLSDFLKEYEEIENEKEKCLTVQKYVDMIIRDVLKLGVDELIDEEMNFFDMGMDSLMVIEMKNKFQVMTAGKISFDVAALVERQTLRAVSEHIHQLLQK